MLNTHMISVPSKTKTKKKVEKKWKKKAETLYCTLDSILDVNNIKATT